MAQEVVLLILFSIVAASIGVIRLGNYFKRQSLTVFEYQWALLYRNGQFQKILPPGVHKLYVRNTCWQIFDRRVNQLTIIGQEVLSKDGMGLKLSTYIEYVIEDPQLLCRNANVANMTGLQSFLYAVAQQPLRAVITQHNLEELIAERETIATQLKEALVPRFAELGIAVRQLGLRDVMLAKEIRDAFAAELLARKQAAVQLEATRAETAALRSLANAARLMRENPEIMKLRVLQAMQNNTGKNTIVVDFSDGQVAQSTAVDAS
ncbi:MAG: slipin family protein [Alphaproteobacteria bacterium]|nr:slipin family protein [Alphaproteobacteria bacterium]